MSELDFGLIAWIKRDQKERQEHKEKMVVKNTRDDDEFLDVLQAAVFNPKLSKRDRLMVANLLRHKEAGKIWSPAQRSIVANFYIKMQK